MSGLVTTALLWGAGATALHAYGEYDNEQTRKAVEQRKKDKELEIERKEAIQQANNQAELQNEMMRKKFAKKANISQILQDNQRNSSLNKVSLDDISTSSSEDMTLSKRSLLGL